MTSDTRPAFTLNLFAMDCIGSWLRTEDKAAITIWPSFEVTAIATGNSLAIFFGLPFAYRKVSCKLHCTNLLLLSNHHLDRLTVEQYSWKIIFSLGYFIGYFRRPCFKHAVSYTTWWNMPQPIVFKWFIWWCSLFVKGVWFAPWAPLKSSEVNASTLQVS